MGKIDIYTTSDTFISNNSRNENFSKSIDLLIGEKELDESTNDFNIGLFHFDLLPIYKCTVIEKAELYLYVNSQLNKIYPEEIQLDIYRILNCYDSSTVTWRTGPNLSKTKYSTRIKKDHRNPYLTIDLTNIVSEWVNKNFPNYGIALVYKKSNEILSFKSTRSNNGPFLRLTCGDFSSCCIPCYSSCYNAETTEIDELHEDSLDYTQVKDGKNEIIGPTESTSYSGKSYENVLNNIAQFQNTAEISKLMDKDLVPLSKVFINGNNIFHVEESPEIKLASNHTYIVSWTIGASPNHTNLAFSLGGQLLLNGKAIPGSKAMQSMKVVDAFQVVVSTSVIFNTSKESNTIQLEYNTLRGSIDEIVNVGLHIIELK